MGVQQLAESKIPDHIRPRRARLHWIALSTGLLVGLTSLVIAESSARSGQRGTIYRLRGHDPVAKPRPLPSQSPSASTNKYSLHITAVRAIDGSNSAGTAGQGAANIALLRKSAVTYPGDGSGTEMIASPDRENPRNISNHVVAQGSVLMPNNRRLTDFVWAWGQFVDHDLDLSGTSGTNGTADIPIEDPHDVLAPNPIPFDRSNCMPGTGVVGNPRQQVNQITAFHDASNVYGSSDGRAQALRTMVGGKLKTSAGDLLPFNVDGIDNAGGTSTNLFLAGDVRSNENVMLTAMHTLFVREHNRLATMLALLDPLADDETLYQLARKIVAAEVQIVTYQEFLPALMGPGAPKPEDLPFNPHVNPGVATEFSTALYRVGHTLLSSNLPLSENGKVIGGISLQTAFFNPGFLVSDPANVDRLMEGFGRQLSQEIDVKIIDDVRNFLFGPPGAGGMDLAALNIQRGRDHGLPDYNTVRAAYGLNRVNSFQQISSDTAVQQTLEEMYGDVDNIDPWVGALAEDHLPGSSVGTLIDAGLKDQFRRAVAGDKFFHLRDPDLKQPAVAAVIDFTTLKFADIILANTTVSSLPTNPFVLTAPVKSDVVACYNADANCLHITGNRKNNSIVIMSTPAGIVIAGINGSRVNGRSAFTVATNQRPNLTVDLNAGTDSLTILAGQFGDGLIVLGGGGNSAHMFGTSFRQVVTAEP